MAAATTDKLMKVGTPGTATTLASPGHTIGGTSITVGSTTNWPTDTQVAFAIDRVTLNGTEEVQVAGSYTEWTGIVTSGTTIGSMSLSSYSPNSDQNYSAGSLTRVYIPVSATRENEIVEWGDVEHNLDGTHDNTVVGLLAGSQTFTGSKTFSATIDFQSAATKLFNVWVAGSGTWTYASATTITVPAADAALMVVGTKIWITQTTSKFYYVTAVSGTTVTVSGGSDYTVANAAITAPYFSNAQNPFGFPKSFAYTPTLTGFSADPTSSVYRFSMDGSLVTLYVRQSANGTSNATSFSISLPVTAKTITNMVWFSAALDATDNGTNLTTPARMQISSAGTTCAVLKDAAGAAWTAANGKRASGTITYEAA